MLPYHLASSDAHAPVAGELAEGVSTEQLDMLKQLYRKLVQHPQGLSKKELCHDTFGLEEGYFADRIFTVFAKNESGRIGESEFVCGLSRLITQDESDFVDFFFDLIDVDSSGHIDHKEVYQCMLASLRANKLTLAYRVTDFLGANSGLQSDMNSDEARARMLADEVFKISTANGASNTGSCYSISRNDFKRVYQSYMSHWGKAAPQLTKTRITTRKFQNFLRRSQHESAGRWSLKRRPFRKRIILWIAQHPARVAWFSIWSLINICLFAWKFASYTFERPEAFELFGYCLSVARGSAEVSRVVMPYGHFLLLVEPFVNQTLKFNVAIALLSVCRALLTMLRNIANGELSRFINIDDEIATHKLCGVAILLFTLMHTAAHICDFHIVGISTASQVNNALGTTYTNETKPSEVELWFTSWQGLTGILMLLCMVVAYPGVLHWMRKRGHFHVFWGTHQALIILTVILMIHGIQNLFEPFTAVYWVGVPFAIYITGRFMRLLTCGKSHRTYVDGTPKLLPPNVLELKLSRGGFADFKAGQYVFLNLPRVSFFEWHPFTLTSAPDDPHLCVHVRSVGGWTRAVHQALLSPAPDDQLPALYVDGPYGAPSQAYERYKVCVFVAAGIGVTPYASILSHILNQVEKRNVRKVVVGEAEPKSGESCVVEKIYLFWTTRDEASVAWFDKILQDLHRLDVSELIEVHHFYTSAHEKGDLRNALIGLAHGIQRERSEEEKDMALFDVHRSRYFSHFGRPDWDIVFEGIKEACSGIDKRCGIFATVPPRFSTILRRSARSHSTSRFRFHYSAENF